ncbi:CDP-alcohol phosphatidyltransferase-domain-containing protein [Lipomyces arxii]|uniref:CDP-alcohol phosphatidyltransferase-domain-containing protein n=1 Tax=Lipomyces arxii TaxID=56418 RepID=UPI0034CDC17F
MSLLLQRMLFGCHGGTFGSKVPNVVSPGHWLGALAITRKKRFVVATIDWPAMRAYSSPGPESPGKSERTPVRQTGQTIYKNTKERTQQAMQKALDKIPNGTKTVFHEDIYTVPNLLTFSRLIVTPGIGYFVLQNNHTWAVSLFVYACVTDLLDGYIARKWDLQSVVGSVIDPMADKVLMVTMTCCLAWIGSLPIWVGTIIIGRDVLLGLSAIYYRYISLPPPKTMQRYWDFSIPSAEVHPTTISKYNTALQMGLITVSLMKPLILEGMTIESQLLAVQAITGLEYCVAGTTVLSGLSYVFSKTAVKIVTEKEIEERRLKRINHQKSDTLPKDGTE